MVFSSIPVYLDPPNWHQQPNHNLGSGSTENHAQLPPLPPPQFGTHVGSGGGGTDGSGGSGNGSIRPNSMADRARMAKIPQPETALKCPRCESTNTKFCYFNNYSLSQPRHFCKTCRRYWTRGGALRNVPVGGGCRRNKKTKTSSSSRSKSPVSASSTENQQMRSNPTGLINQLSQPQAQSLPFLESIQNLSRYGGAGNMGLNGFNEIQQAQAQAQSTDQMLFQMGAGNNMMNLSGGLGMDQWRNFQQIPFLGGNGFETSSTTGLYPFQNTTEGADQDSQLRTTNSRVTTTHQVPPVKVEDHNHGVGLTRPFLGMTGNNNNGNSNNHTSNMANINSSSNNNSTTTTTNNNNNSNNQFWGGNAWTDLSGTLNSSSTSHLL